MGENEKNTHDTFVAWEDEDVVLNQEFVWVQSVGNVYMVSVHPVNNQSILILFVFQGLKLSVMYKDFSFGKPSCSADEL
jgi:hypothetical protein